MPARTPCATDEPIESIDNSLDRPPTTARRCWVCSWLCGGIPRQTLFATYSHIAVEEERDEDAHAQLKHALANIKAVVQYPSLDVGCLQRSVILSVPPISSFQMPRPKDRSAAVGQASLGVGRPLSFIRRVASISRVSSPPAWRRQSAAHDEHKGGQKGHDGGGGRPPAFQFSFQPEVQRPS